MTRAYKVYPIYKSRKGLSMTYTNIDWTINDLPKQVFVPDFAWAEIAQDVRLQIIVNTAMKLDIDCQNNLAVVYKPYSQYVEFFITDEEIDDKGLFIEDRDDVEEIFN